MNKTIKILSIVAMVFSCVAFLLSVAILTFLWRQVNILMDTHEIIIEQGPIIPIGNMLYMIFGLLIALIIFITSESKKFIVIEVISIILLSVVFPLSTHYLDTMQTISIGKLMGDNATAVLAVTSNSLLLPLSVMKLSSALCLITCGMRITEKFYLKQLYNNMAIDNYK